MKEQAKTQEKELSKMGERNSIHNGNESKINHIVNKDTSII